MGKTILTPSQELNIIKDYTENGMGIYPLCEKYKVGKIKIKAIFEKYNIGSNVNSSRASISKCINGKQKSIKGFTFIKRSAEL